MKSLSLAIVVGAILFARSPLLAQEIPITTSSDEARALYIKGRDLAERFRTDETLPLYQKAIALDSNFAMAYLNLAFRQTTNKDFRAYLSKAVALSEKVSEGERMMIQVYQARMKNERANEKALWEKLLKLYPDDKRLRATVGDIFFFTYNEPERAIAEYKKAIEIEASYHPAYNSIGYVYGILGKYDEAEKALKKYTELLPDEANPHDTYAEVLMKQGKFDESIAEYKKSLSIDPKFYFSHIGLGMDYVFTGKPDEGRKQFQTLYDVAFDDNDRSQAIIASTKSYLIEGRFDKAVEEQRKNYALSQKQNDPFGMSGDLLLSAWILSEHGKTKEASMEVQKAAEMLTSVPHEQVEAMALGLLRTDARVEAKSGDIGKAKSKVEEYKKKAAASQNTTHMKLAQLFAGMIAAREKHYDDALNELQQADQRNAQTLFVTAQVYAAKGDKAKAKEFFSKAANFNDMSWEYALVRKKAKEALAKLK